ncbi:MULTISPECIES: metallophosphoesterase [unclassified Bradyrhizobium]|uniref:metallophosphoesterase n=1 Tax=unclassified Bradyrhizobium TaxID=2631580 RepID=UPI00291666F8|nr:MULTISPECIES: metallophosphoesterase [unclassified Bradyrhizobium]
MRYFAVSDIHVDFDANADWVANLSSADYRDDVLILAGDVSDTLHQIDWCLRMLVQRFRKVLFVPGNHDLWVLRDWRNQTSLQKFDKLAAVVEANGASMRPFYGRGVSIVPLFGWYDYSFGEPTDELRSIWMDYYACRWPVGFQECEITAHFTSLNKQHLKAFHGKVITFSHFLPRIDLMPSFIPAAKRFLYPVLGAARLDGQLRLLNASIHVYGHSHVNRCVKLDGVCYINNAFGYPHEMRVASKRLLCIYQC